MTSNMRVATLFLFVLLFAVTPVLLLNYVVLPQLDALEYTYSHADEIAARVVQE